jgi:hypothetical protein
MSNSQYGRKLNPYRSAREHLGVKGVRESVVFTHDPSTIDQSQHLLVNLLTLAEAEIVPGTTRLSFEISLTSTDPNRTLVNIIGRAIVKKITIKIHSQEVMSVDHADVFYCYCDMWRPSRDRENAHYHGIDTSEERNVNKLRIDAEDADETKQRDKAVADHYGKRFCIPLDFELLESHMPYYQSGFSGVTSLELTFNDYNRVIIYFI